jgi:O-antigen/teichoic acid export membrane protein
MKVFSNVVKNTGTLFFATLVQMFTSFILTIFIARYLGSAGMGTFAIVYSLFMLFQKLATIGLEPVIIREVSKEKSRAKKYIFNVSLMVFVSSILMMIIMVFFVIVLRYSREIILSTCIISGSLIITSLKMPFRAVFIAFGKTKYIFYGNVVENIIKLSMSILLLHLGFGIPTLVIIVAISPLASLFIYIYILLKHGEGEKPRFDRQLCKWLIKVLPTFAGTQYFHAFSGNITVIILSLMMSVEFVGFYSAAMRLVNLFRLLINSYKVAIQPVIAQSYAISLESMRKFCIKSIKYILLLTVPICFGATILAERIIILVYSTEFLPSANIFRILIWTICIYGISMVLSNILIASDFQKINLRTVAVSMLCRIVIAVILIPLINHFGAAIAVLIGSLVNYAQKYIFISNKFFKIRILEISRKIILSTIIMTMFITLCYRLNIVILVCSSAVLFILSLSILGESVIHDVLWSRIQFIKRK